jgi:Large polyvalent protein associated domain 29
MASPTAETAKKIRKALSLAFPGFLLKVSTKNSADGQYIGIYWTDGPTEKHVDKVCTEVDSRVYFECFRSYSKQVIDRVERGTGSRKYFFNQTLKETSFYEPPKDNSPVPF